VRQAGERVVCMVLSFIMVRVMSAEGWCGRLENVLSE
jgi:hypothetical protein